MKNDKNIEAFTKTKEPKLFQFGDGLKPVEVGQQIIYRGGDSRDKAFPMYVLKVGRTLISIGWDKDGRESHQFYIETGKKKSDYGWGSTLYSSLEAYKTFVEESGVISKAQKLMREVNSLNKRLTYSQALQIIEVLEEKS